MSGRTVSDKRISLHRPGYSYFQQLRSSILPLRATGTELAAWTIFGGNNRGQKVTSSVGSESGRALLSPTTLPAAFHPSESTTIPLPSRSSRLSSYRGRILAPLDRSMPRACSLLDEFPRSRADSFEIARQGRLFLFLFVFLARLPLEKLYYLERLLDERVARFVEEETYGWIRVSN